MTKKAKKIKSDSISKSLNIGGNVEKSVVVEGNNNVVKYYDSALVEAEKQDREPPHLELHFTDELGRHQNELTFSQRANNQEFIFGFVLANVAEKSLPAEKIDIRVECSWDGNEIEKAPNLQSSEN